MNASGLRKRLSDSASDFVRGVQPALEQRLGVRVYPIEDLEFSELSRRLDLSGVDAFYYDKSGDPRALGSRMNYHAAASLKPAFTFRYALWDEKRKTWDTAREFLRKARAISEFCELIICPKLHVESFSREKASGDISWSFAADTEHLIKFIYHNFDNPEKVSIFEPRVGERRKVISVTVESFARDYPVIELGASRP